MTVLCPTGRHVTAAEALKLGLVDRVTDRNTVEEAVKFALSVAGEMQQGKKNSSSYLRESNLFSPLSSLKIYSAEEQEMPSTRVILGKPVIKTPSHLCCGSQRRQRNM